MPHELLSYLLFIRVKLRCKLLLELPFGVYSDVIYDLSGRVRLAHSIPKKTRTDIIKRIADLVQILTDDDTLEILLLLGVQNENSFVW